MLINEKDLKQKTKKPVPVKCFQIHLNTAFNLPGYNMFWEISVLTIAFTHTIVWKPSFAIKYFLSLENVDSVLIMECWLAGIKGHSKGDNTTVDLSSRFRFLDFNMYNYLKL